MADAKYVLADVDDNPESVVCDGTTLKKGGSPVALREDQVLSIRYAGHLIETAEERKKREAQEAERASAPEQEATASDAPQNEPLHLSTLGPVYAQAAPDPSDSIQELAGEDLDAAVREADIEGRSSMTADEKRDALAAEAAQGETPTNPTTMETS